MSDDAHPTSHIGAPSPWLAALEYRALAERMHFSVSTPILRMLPHGDGHAVIVLPGFTAGDRSTEPLRRLLRSLGYRTYSWGLGVNVGPTERILEGLSRRLDDVAGRREQPVSLVGWSLGGIYARELARARPDQVRLAITLGSPIQMIDRDRSSAQAMWEALSRYHAPRFERTVRDVHRPPLVVPSTSIYSKTDGIVRWQASLVERTPISENVRVYGSHCGLGFNASVAYVIADRLAQPADGWRHFSPPWWVRASFPPADDLDATRLPGAA